MEQDFQVFFGGIVTYARIGALSCVSVFGKVIWARVRGKGKL